MIHGFRFQANSFGKIPSDAGVLSIEFSRLYTLQQASKGGLATTYLGMITARGGGLCTYFYLFILFLDLHSFDREQTRPDTSNLIDPSGRGLCMSHCPKMRKNRQY